MAKTQQEKRDATMKRVVRDSLRLALSHIETDDFEGAATAVEMGSPALQALSRAQVREMMRTSTASHVQEHVSAMETGGLNSRGDLGAS